jgi:hypothetical protein
MGARFTISLSGLPTPAQLALSPPEQLEAWAEFMALLEPAKVQSWASAFVELVDNRHQLALANELMARANRVVARLHGLPVPPDDGVPLGLPTPSSLATIPPERVWEWAAAFVGDPANRHRLAEATDRMRQANLIRAEDLELSAPPDGLDAPLWGRLSRERLPTAPDLALSRFDEVVRWAEAFIADPRRQDLVAEATRRLIQANRTVAEEYGLSRPVGGREVTEDDRTL